MLKKFLILFFVTVTALSCSNHMEEDTLLLDAYTYEEYVPKGDVKEVLLATGDVIYLDESDGTYFLGDVIFTAKQVEEWQDEKKTKAAVLTSAENRWTGRIKYYIEPGFTSSAIAAIRSGVDMINNAVLSIRIEETSAPISKYGLVFTPTLDTNSSPVGRNELNIIKIIYNQNSAGVVAHEIMHSLGFFHEQCRTDRDDYVTIHFDNIKAGKEHNFKTFSQLGFLAENRGTYDYNSIMHYGSWYFSIDEKTKSYPTITKKDGSTFSAQRVALTTDDKKAVDRYYGVIPYAERQFLKEERRETFTGIDLTTTYANAIIFRDVDGNRVPLPFDATFEITLRIYQKDPMNPNGYTTDQSFIVTVKAGALFYNNLVETKDIIREDLGINYYTHEETYYAKRID